MAVLSLSDQNGSFGFPVFAKDFMRAEKRGGPLAEAAAVERIQVIKAHASAGQDFFDQRILFRFSLKVRGFLRHGFTRMFRIHVLRVATIDRST